MNLAPTTTITYRAVSCCTCSVHFCMDKVFYTRRVNDKEGWYCPNGHIQYFAGETDLQKAEQKIKSLEAWTRTQENYLQQEKYQHAATKGKLTKFKNRVAAGVCPCCHRTFQNVQRHMTGQHPDFTATA